MSKGVHAHAAAPSGLPHLDLRRPLPPRRLRLEVRSGDPEPGRGRRGDPGDGPQEIGAGCRRRGVGITVAPVYQKHHRATKEPPRLSGLCEPERGKARPGGTTQRLTGIHTAASDTAIPKVCTRSGSPLLDQPNPGELFILVVAAGEAANHEKSSSNTLQSRSQSRMTQASDTPEDRGIESRRQKRTAQRRIGEKLGAWEFFGLFTGPLRHILW